MSALNALIGRDHPAGLLRAEMERAAQSHGGLVLVAGEAGIGKTTLVTGALEEARQQGALVLSGSCWASGGAPGYWPWVQVLRALRREVPGAAAEASLDALLGEGAEEGPGDALGDTEDSADAFRVYDSVTSALVDVAQQRPVLVVLDDLHWADPASLRLLEFAAQHTWFERLLLIGTYRDVEVEAADGHPLRELMAPLLAKATTVTLTGLGPEETGRLLARTAGAEPDAALVDLVHQRTGGNPFFVEQTARLWMSGGSVSALPPGVRDTVRRRLSLLPEPVAALLADAAVLGREFHRRLLAAVAGAPVAHADRLLERAVAARLVTAEGAGRFTFAHDLVRETLVEGLGEAGAAERHAAVVRALEHGAAAAPAELAGHAYAAGEAVPAERVVELIMAAARDAGGRLAFEEEAAHYRRAYERASELPRRRAVIGLKLAEGLWHSGERDESRQVFAEAAALARELAEPALLGRAALSLHSYEVKEGLLREAYEALIGGPLPDAERMAQEVSIKLAALARAGGDDEELEASLWARHHTIWGPGTAPERIALTDELQALSRRTGDAAVEAFAASLRWVAQLELGDPQFLASYQAYVAIAKRQDRPLLARWLAIDGSIICGMQGRFEEAERLYAEALEGGEAHSHDQAEALLEQHRWALRMLQGRYEEAAAIARGIASMDHPCPRVLAGLTSLRLGEPEPALALLAEGPPGETGRRRGWLPLWLRFQAQAAAASGDPELIAQAREALSPYRGQWSVSLWGWDISGPVDLWAAQLDAADSRWDEAIAGFTAAGDSAELLLARPWAVEARAQLARALEARGGEGDAAAAASLWEAVRREAAELGLRQLAEEAPADAPGAEFRLDGKVWTLSFLGRTVHMPDAKGLRDIHTLLSLPGTEIPAARLLSPEGGEEAYAARSLGGDPVLDDAAKAAYKRRLDLLDEEIDRAAAVGQEERAAAYDREREALLNELRSAAGLAGRTRRLGDESERARKAVTGRIRDVLRRLEPQHAGLAAHLRETLSTGSTCAYRPPGGMTWRL